MNEVTLEVIRDQLDEVLRRLSMPVPPAQGARNPWEVPELGAHEITPETMDGVTIQRDGSVWGRNIHSGAPEGLMYGYISKAKNPAMWSRMVAVFGGDEARLQSIIDSNGVSARYKLHPEAVLHQGANSFFLLSSLLSNPIGG